MKNKTTKLTFLGIFLAIGILSLAIYLEISLRALDHSKDIQIINVP